MTTNKLYRRQLEAARRAARWADAHPTATRVFFATGALICALYVYLYYPL